MRRRRSRPSFIAASSIGPPVSASQPWFARFMVGAVILAAVVGLSGLIGRWGVDGGWFEGIDAFTIDANPTSTLTAFLVGVTWLGTTTGVVTVSILMLLVLLLRRMFRGAAAFLASLLTAAYTNDFLKEWVARERPEHAGIIEQGGYSYLSGHAFVCTAVYGLFCYLLIRKSDRPAARWVLGFLAVIILGLIGFSRIYLGVHYASDVIGGYILGILWMTVWAVVFRPFGVKAARR